MRLRDDNEDEARPVKPLEQEKINKIVVQFRNSNNAMETRYHSKNGASLKSQMSKGNKYSFVIFVCLFFFGAFSTYAQEEKPKIAVIDLGFSGKYTAGQYSDVMAANLTGILTTDLVNTKKYVVMERSRIQQIINELRLQSTQDASARAAEIGHLLGVNKIITGEVVETNIGGLRAAQVNLRLIDVESGGIEAAVSVDNALRDKKGKMKNNGFYNAVAISDTEFAKRILDALLN